MPSPLGRRAPALGVVVALGVLVSGTVVYAAGLEPDGTHLRGQWTTGGGDAWLELEDRNVEPVICFLWRNDAPQSGDSVTSRILTRAGAEVVDLGTADQWIDGVGQGCEIPDDDRYHDVFAHPDRYVVELRVVENQGTPATGPLRSGPLERASG